MLMGPLIGLLLGLLGRCSGLRGGVQCLVGENVLEAWGPQLEPRE
jgi:hypothetical protein